MYLAKVSSFPVFALLKVMFPRDFYFPALILLDSCRAIRLQVLAEKHVLLHCMKLYSVLLDLYTIQSIVGSKL